MATTQTIALINTLTNIQRIQAKFAVTNGALTQSASLLHLNNDEA